jgi:prepilin-type N-terminal cleavage/methylation domain-containing protein
MNLINKNLVANKKGFTLIELIGVILLLGIISLIAVPAVSNIIQQSKKEAFRASVIYIFEATTIYIYDNNYPDIPSEGLDVTIINNIDPNPFISGYIFRNNNDKYELANVSDGKYCANGEKSNLIITKGVCNI